MTRVRCFYSVTVLATFLLTVVACDDSTTTTVAPPAEGSASGPVSLRVMAFNIEWGGTHVRFASLADAIREADADIVAIQEAEGNLARLADDLGWHYSRRNFVISKYALIDPPEGNGIYVFVEVLPGEVVAVASVHLPSDPYGPEWLQEERTVEDVLAMERATRLAAIEPVLQALRVVQERDIPLFLAGDFNAPSHADWTEASVARYPHRKGAFEWPVSRAVADAGFHDSYRAAHADPVARPGFTWWAARPRIEDYNPSDELQRDRIDFVWYTGPATLIDSRLVGEEGADGVDIALTPWPSDHRAVVSLFETTPVPMPPLISTDQRVYAVGESVQIVHQASHGLPQTILVQRPARPGSVTPQVRMPVTESFGRLELADGALPAGHYSISLIDDSGFPASKNEFWILDPDATPTVRVAGVRHAAGETLPIAWSNTPGNRNDWIGIFDAAAGDDSEAYVSYGYVGARSSGSMLLGPDTVEGAWPLPPGTYVARLMLDDGFRILAKSAPFSVE
jgi:endonuclease/exonuclease/phosphatase family metal-dependent hydrolase